MSELLRQDTVKTRKPHRCWGCLDTIPVGTMTRVDVSIDMGQVFSCYFCEICDKFDYENHPTYDDEGLCKGEMKTLDGYKEFRESQLQAKEGKRIKHEAFAMLMTSGTKDTQRHFNERRMSAELSFRSLVKWLEEHNLQSGIYHPAFKGTLVLNKQDWQCLKDAVKEGK